MIKQRRSGWKVSLGLVLLLGAYVAWALWRPLPATVPEYTRQLQVQTDAGTLAWPANGQAAISLLNNPTTTTHGEQKPTPMASTAKVITSLLLLEKMPLRLGETGPTISITEADVAIYSRYVSQGGSVVPVQAGEKLNQYQAMQAIMLPSANNMADTMAIHAYGSLPAYSKAANAFLRSKGIMNTTVGSDASGLSPDSVSTAADLVKLGKLAMSHPVLSSIVGQATATGIPMTTEIRNVNFLLGTDGIVGIKTGTSDQAGGAFVGAAKRTINGKNVTIISAVVGAPDRFSAINPSRPLLNSGGNNFKRQTLLRKNQVVGIYKTPWGSRAEAVSTTDGTATLWQSEYGKVSLNLLPLQPDDDTAGKATLAATSVSDAKTIPIKLQRPLAPPSLQWRLMHPL
jgi:serine-type D-Ala-D-Ala carboxypeptidase (penicillin-binding protein 5/6)